MMHSADRWYVLMCANLVIVCLSTDIPEKLIAAGAMCICGALFLKRPGES